MSAELQAKVQASPAQNFTPVQTGLLQRKYALCNTPGLVEDSERDKEKLTLQRSSVEPRFGHDFSRVSILNDASVMIQKKLTINQPNDRYEQEADRVADEVMRMAELEVQRQPEDEEILQTKKMESATPEVTSDLESQIHSIRGGGQPLMESDLAFFEQLFGYDFSQVRLHDSPAARMAAAKLGARAFTYGNDIGLGPGESESDKSLMTHELAHVVQQNFGQIHLRRATWAERAFWIVFFPHYLPRKLLNNYMDDTGNPIELTQQEMIDCNVVVDVRGIARFSDELISLIRAGGGSRDLVFSGSNIANRTGTLANFTINYRGRLTVDINEPWGWTFRGTMDFYDFYDFDPRPYSEGSRTISGEHRVRVGDYYIPGRPFPITSVPVPVLQIGTDDHANWGQQTLARVPIGPVVPLSPTERTEPVPEVASQEERYARRRRELARAARVPLRPTERTEPAVQRVVGIQAKLVVRQPKDKYEQEADRVADAVMRMPEPSAIERITMLQYIQPLRIQRLCSEYREKLPWQSWEEVQEEERLRAIETLGDTPRVTPYLENQLNGLRSRGQPLPEFVRAFFEPLFGYDLSKVRIHVNPQDRKVAQSLGARAFTVGRDIVFGAETYTPDTKEGRWVLAHELTHVIQQNMVDPPRTRFTSSKSLDGEQIPNELWTHHPESARLVYPTVRVYDNLRGGSLQMLAPVVAAIGAAALAALRGCILGGLITVLLDALAQYFDALARGEELNYNACLGIFSFLIGCFTGGAAGFARWMVTEAAIGSTAGFTAAQILDTQLAQLILWLHTAGIAIPGSAMALLFRMNCVQEETLARGLSIASVPEPLE